MSKRKMIRDFNHLRFTVLTYGTPAAARRWRALEAVARAAERYAWSLEDDDPLARALARLKKAGAR